MAPALDPDGRNFNADNILSFILGGLLDVVVLGSIPNTTSYFLKANAVLVPTSRFPMEKCFIILGTDVDIFCD